MIVDPNNLEPQRKDAAADARRTSRHELARRCAALRRQGASLDDIARAVGVGRGVVGRLLKKWYTILERERKDLGETALAAELDKLDGLRRGGSENVVFSSYRPNALMRA